MKAEQIGATRTVTAFLLLPMRIGSEIRWLRKASWTERYGFVNNTDLIVAWIPVRWIE